MSASLSAGAQGTETTLKPGIPSMPNQQEKIKALPTGEKFRGSTADDDDCEAIESKIVEKTSIRTESKVEAYTFIASQGCVPEGAPTDDDVFFSEGALFQENDEVRIPPEGAPFPKDHAAVSNLELQAAGSPFSEEGVARALSAKAVTENTTTPPSSTIKHSGYLKGTLNPNCIPELRRNISISNNADLQVQIKVSSFAFYLL